MSRDFEAIATKVSPAVVKVLVTGYGPVTTEGRENAAVIARQHSIGSGAILDPSGYIVTNAHVVKGAQRVRIVIPPATASTETVSKARILPARIVGIDAATDLAVLKVEATGLPFLEIGDYRNIHQGQLVLAFGSPEGLEDTVTMGVVSSVMRQPDPDEPMIYIQTDAAVNPGNSGGPLVDIAGRLIGINTFILSESGGSEGLNFAVPSVIVRFVYQEILAHGHVHRRRIGVHLQAITPSLASGLGLSRDEGLIVADVQPGGPAEKAGLRIQDILLALDGAPVEALPMFEAALYRKEHGQSVVLDVLRGSQKLSLKIPVIEQAQHGLDDVMSMADPEKGLIQPLGILGVEITPKLAEVVQDLRINSGVIVAA